MSLTQTQDIEWWAPHRARTSTGHRLPCLGFRPVICPHFQPSYANQEVADSRVRPFFPQWDEKNTTVSTSQSSKLHILDTMCLARYVDCVPQNKEKTKKKRRQKTECVCACDCVPEEPDVYDYKDMLCWGFLWASYFSFQPETQDFCYTQVLTQRTDFEIFWNTPPKQLTLRISHIDFNSSLVFMK